MKTLLLTLCFCLAISWLPGYASAHPDLVGAAESYVGVVESGGANNGVEVRTFLRSVGLGKGYAWCAAFVSHCLNIANSTFPVRSAAARAFVRKNSVKASDVLLGKYVPQRNDLVIWQRGNTVFGHIGVVETALRRNAFRTIEGNTGAGAAGSQHDGDGVYRRIRSIAPSNYFRITHFTTP